MTTEQTPSSKPKIRRPRRTMEQKEEDLKRQLQELAAEALAQAQERSLLAANVIRSIHVQFHARPEFKAALAALEAFTKTLK